MLVVDNTPKPWWQVWKPDPWFQAGGHIAATLDRIDDVIDLPGESFDEVIFALTPDDLYKAIEKFKPLYVEFHGHGMPGSPRIGSKAIDPRHRCWRHVKRVFFRACYVAQGPRGHEFMETLALTCDVAAHISMISGFAQSYLVGLRRSADPSAWWPMGLKPKGSSLVAPRTILPVQGLPAWAFEEGHGL